MIATANVQHSLPKELNSLRLDLQANQALIGLDLRGKQYFQIPNSQERQNLLELFSLHLQDFGTSYPKIHRILFFRRIAWRKSFMNTNQNFFEYKDEL